MATPSSSPLASPWQWGTGAQSATWCCRCTTSARSSSLTRGTPAGWWWSIRQTTRSLQQVSAERDPVRRRKVFQFIDESFSKAKKQRIDDEKSCSPRYVIANNDLPHRDCQPACSRHRPSQLCRPLGLGMSTTRYRIYRVSLKITVFFRDTLYNFVNTLEFRTDDYCWCISSYSNPLSFTD